MSGRWRDNEAKKRYMRAYHRANYERLHPFSVQRTREWRARKARQSIAVDQFLEAFERFEYARRCEAVRAEISAEAREWK
jgi:hypothetical protein